MVFESRSKELVGLCSVLFDAFLIFCSSCAVSQKSASRSALPVVSPTVTKSKGLLRTASGKTLNELFKKADCRLFFDAFPESFPDFVSLYGYDDDQGANPLYSSAEDHIAFLFECKEVTPSEKLQKAIKLTINGRWEADGPALLQDRIVRLVKRFPEQTKEILDRRTDEDAASFWYFLIDGPHPTDRVNLKSIRILRKRLGEASKQSRILMKQFAKLKKLDSEPH